MASDQARRVLVTGGASGIGRAITRRFGADGERVAVLDVDTEALERLPEEESGVELVVPGDVADPGAVSAAFSALDDYWGACDIVLNNAGVSVREPFLEATPDHWNRVLSVNLTGTFLVSQQAAVRMCAQGSGTIINIGSVSGMVGMPLYAGYNVSKAGVIELTKTIALELAPTVRVNAICPGYVLTPMQAREYTDAMVRECETNVPAGRLGAPEEIAALATYLASDDATFITGQSFVIDGGEAAGGLASRPGLGVKDGQR